MPGPNVDEMLRHDVKRLEIVAILAFVVVVAWAVGSSVITTRHGVLCTYAGSPYLDAGIPDECEQGELPQFNGTMPPEYLEYFARPNPSLYEEILTKYGR